MDYGNVTTQAVVYSIGWLPYAREAGKGKSSQEEIRTFVRLKATPVVVTTKYTRVSLDSSGNLFE